MTTLRASDTRIPPQMFNRVVYQGERVRVEHRSGEAVYIISADDLDLLTAIEDHLDVEAAREAIRQMKAAGQKPIPWEQVKRKLGL